MTSELTSSPNRLLLIVQKSHRLSLAQALLSRSTLVSLAASNPALALALQTIRLRVLLRQYMAAASQRPSKEGLQTDAVQYGSKY